MQQKSQIVVATTFLPSFSRIAVSSSIWGWPPVWQAVAQLLQPTSATVLAFATKAKTSSMGFFWVMIMYNFSFSIQIRLIKEFAYVLAGQTPPPNDIIIPNLRQKSTVYKKVLILFSWNVKTMKNKKIPG
jgi:hypothetical protein